MAASSAPASRRIRFAPLPDPRRSVLVAEDGTELPLPQLFIENSNFDSLDSKLESPLSARSELASIPAAISLSALNSPVHTPLHTPQNWNVPLPEMASSPARFEKTLSLESDSSNSSNTSSCAGSTSGSPPTSELSSSASSMYSLTPTQSIDPYPSSSTGSSTPTQPMRKSSSLRGKLSSKYNISTDQLLTFGAINLFRSRSKGKDKVRDSDRDSIQSAQGVSGWGGALTRWTSGGSGGPRDAGGVPMYRTQSTQSYKGENVRNKRSSSPSSIKRSRSGSNSSKLNPARESGMISTLHTGGPTKKGTRMLNGRVYGARRGSSSGSPVNPFANAKDDPDPEFVEWGYGGMGSVKNVQDGVGGRVWGRVLSSGTGAHDTKEGVGTLNSAGIAVQGGAVSPKDDDDDGSGMGWVRKRREAREREAKEKAEKEAKEQAEKERLEKEAQEKAAENEDARSFTSTNTCDTNGTAGTIRNIPTPLPLPDVGDLDVLPEFSPGGSAVGSPTPTLGSMMGTPTPSGVATSIPPAIEGVLSSPSSGLSPDLRTSPMARQTSNTSTTSSAPLSPGKEEEHHVLTAVNIPAPPPISKHHSHHSHSHSHHQRSKSLLDAISKVESGQGKAETSSEDKASGDQAVSNAAIGEKVVQDDPIHVTSKDTGNDEHRESPSPYRNNTRKDSVSSTSSSSSSISSQSGSESESESEEKNPGESDEEDEESEEEKARKTSLGAGVEKISRHK